MNKKIDTTACREKLLGKKSFKEINLPDRKIILPNIYGFCGGVVNAIETILQTINNYEKRNIYLLGNIIHNPTVNKTLKETGVKILSNDNLYNIFKIADKEDIIVIPAFGIPLALKNKLLNNFPNIVDTTCINVKKVWDFINREIAFNSTILLHGKPEHPEVHASISRVENKNAVIILRDYNKAKIFAEYIAYLQKSNSENKVNLLKNFLEENNIKYLNLKNFNLERFALANQTTMLYNETIQIQNILKNLLSESTIEIITCETICKATYQRQQSALEMCRQNPDIIFTVGGYDSSNTNHLYQLAKQHAPTYYISDSTAIGEKYLIYYDNELKEEKRIELSSILKQDYTIGILAGASCPFSIINEVIEKLKTIPIAE